MGKNAMVKRLWTRAAISLLGAGLIGTGAGCKADRHEENRPVSPELRFEDVHYRVYQGPRLQAEGVAARAAYRRESAGVSAERIELRFPPVSGRDEVRSRAARGEGSLRVRDFTADGGVTLEQRGDVASTESAHYSGADGLVRGDRSIQVRGRAYTLTGPGFTLDPRKGDLIVQGGAKLVAGAGGRR